MWGFTTECDASVLDSIGGGQRWWKRPRRMVVMLAGDDGDDDECGDADGMSLPDELI